MARINVNASFATLGPVFDGNEVPNSQQTVTFTLRDRDCKPIDGLHAVHFLINFTSANGADGTIEGSVALAVNGIASYTVSREMVGFPSTHLGAFTGRIGCITADGTIISDPFTIPAE